MHPSHYAHRPSSFSVVVSGFFFEMGSASSGGNNIMRKLSTCKLQKTKSRKRDRRREKMSKTTWFVNAVDFITPRFKISTDLYNDRNKDCTVLWS